MSLEDKTDHGGITARPVPRAADARTLEVSYAHPAAAKLPVTASDQSTPVPRSSFDERPCNVTQGCRCDQIRLTLFTATSCESGTIVRGRIAAIVRV